MDVRDVSGTLVCYGLWGPSARSILQPLTPLSLAGEDFRFMTSASTTLGEVPVRMTRVTFVGELGWEVYAPSEYGSRLWELLFDAGRPYDFARHDEHAA